MLSTVATRDFIYKLIYILISNLKGSLNMISQSTAKWSSLLRSEFIYGPKNCLSTDNKTQITYVEGLAFRSTGRPGSASLFRSPKQEAKCRSFSFFFSDEGMTAYHIGLTNSTFWRQLSRYFSPRSDGGHIEIENDVICCIKHAFWLDGKLTNYKHSKVVYQRNLEKPHETWKRSSDTKLIGYIVLPNHAL